MLTAFLNSLLIPLSMKNNTAIVYLLEIFEEIEKYVNKIELENGNIYVHFNDGIKLRFNDYEVFLVYIELLSEYQNVDVNNRTVVDIGAHTGDSPLFFISRGAKNLIAFEPRDNFYNQALINIELNNFNDKVIIYNKGVGDDVFDFDLKNLKSVSVFSKVSNKKELPLISFEEFQNIITGHINYENWILKLDCEGCEFHFLLSPNNLETLIKMGLNEIIMEYHNSEKIFEIITKLNTIGFNILSYNEKRKNLGILHAKITS